AGLVHIGLHEEGISCLLSNVTDGFLALLDAPPSEGDLGALPGKCQCCCVANPCGSTGYEDHFPVKLTRGTFPFQDARFRQLDNGSNQGDQARLIARECKLDLRPCHWASKTHESSANLDCTSSSLVSSTSNTTVGTAASSPRNSAGPGN